MECSQGIEILRQKLNNALLLLRKGERPKEDLTEAIMRAIECDDASVAALGVMLASELGMHSVIQRLKQLTGREERAVISDPVSGSTYEVSLGEVASKALENLKSKKVEPELLRIASQMPELPVRVVVEPLGVRPEELARKLMLLGGIKIIHILRLAGAVSVEAKASKVLEIAELDEVLQVRRARIFHALGGTDD